MVDAKLKILIVALGVVIVAMLAILIFVPAKPMPSSSSTNATSTDNVQPAISQDGHVEIGAPLADELITSPARISGNVTGGGWFFEASFPIKILDADGTVLGQGTAQAMSDWMSTGTVPFSASISFSKPHSLSGTIVLSKDNPSGLPQNAASLSIPVQFAIATSTVITPQPTSTTTIFKNDSGVRGTITLGPTCPVERIPPDPQCAPKPYQTQITVYKNNGNTIVTTSASAADGTFTIALPAGNYTIAPRGGGGMPPTCRPIDIAISAGTFLGQDLTCDTGIR